MFCHLDSKTLSRFSIVDFLTQDPVKIYSAFTLSYGWTNRFLMVLLSITALIHLLLSIATSCVKWNSVLVMQQFLTSVICSNKFIGLKFYSVNQFVQERCKLKRGV